MSRQKTDKRLYINQLNLNITYQYVVMLWKFHKEISIDKIIQFFMSKL